jgi:hypothetical protein
MVSVVHYMSLNVKIAPSWQLELILCGRCTRHAELFQCRLLMYLTVIARR